MFVILAQPSAFAQPGEGALDDPAFGQHLKPCGVRVLGHDRQFPALLGDPGFELPGVPAVRPQAHQAGQLANQWVEHEFGPGAVLDIGRVDHETMDQSQGIDDKVAFASLKLLASIIAARPLFRSS